MPSSQNHRISRRGVLRSTAATATTALMQGFSSLGTFRPAVADQRNELGIGVIGCRYQGSVIAGLAKSHGRLLATDVDALEGVELSDGSVNRHFPLTNLA